MSRTVRISLQPVRLQILKDLELLRCAKEWPADSPEAEEVNELTHVLDSLNAIMQAYACVGMGASVQFGPPDEDEDEDDDDDATPLA